MMERVLIVDDEQMDRVIHGNIIEQTGREVYYASDGEQALKVHLKKGIDVVITDLQMPHVNGLELITNLRSAFPKAAIIVISGLNADLLAEVKSIGALLVLSKPVDPNELVEALEEVSPINVQLQHRAAS